MPNNEKQERIILRKLNVSKRLTQFIFTMYIGLQCFPVKVNYSNFYELGYLAPILIQTQSN